MKDVHNIATRFKDNAESPTHSSEVQDIFKWIKNEYPGIDCDFSVKDNVVLSGIYIQDAEMKSIFVRFPEVLLSDSTYKTNNVNMALYVLVATDGDSESHVIAAFYPLQKIRFP